jgi:hypothetical protein
LDLHLYGPPPLSPIVASSESVTNYESLSYTVDVAEPGLYRIQVVGADDWQTNSYILDVSVDEGSYTSLLLHMDGTDGSTDFPDSCGGHSVTAYYDAQIDTAEFMYGGASGLFDGAADYVGVGVSSDWSFGYEDFTIEMLVRPDNLTGYFGLFELEGPSSHMWLFVNDDYVGFTWEVDASEEVALESGSVITLDWQYLAVTRSGDTWWLYVDGSPQGSQTYGGIDVDLDGPMFIGSSAFDQFDGHIDEVRITTGEALYTGSPYVPTGPLDCI